MEMEILQRVNSNPLRGVRLGLKNNLFYKVYTQILEYEFNFNLFSSNQTKSKYLGCLNRRPKSFLQQDRQLGQVSIKWLENIIFEIGKTATVTLMCALLN